MLIDTLTTLAAVGAFAAVLLVAGIIADYVLPWLEGDRA